MMTDIAELDGLQRILIDERPRLLRFIAARGLRDEAEDVFHDLWQRVGETPARPVAEPLSYLFRAAENLIRDRRRSGERREARQEAWQATALPDRVEPVGERAIIARQRLGAADAVLASLGPRVDRVFRRFRIDGVGQAAIAREQGISLSAVEKDLAKAYGALARLKAQFDAE